MELKNREVRRSMARGLAQFVLVLCLLKSIPLLALEAPEFQPSRDFGKYESLGIERVQHGVSVASGIGVASMVPVRVGIQRSFGCRLCPRKANEDWPIGGYWEASAYSMRGKQGPFLHSSKQMNAMAVAGVLRVERRCRLEFGIWPYLDVGIGLSWVSKKTVCSRELGIQFQFEDRLGVGFRFGDNRQYDVGYRVIHFSNAYLDSRNAGINLHLLVLGYWF